ncbi:hypothetical protein HAX54_038065 [Datura stramonium]|uniref:Uncharacterized protein n=1 Tax=Datura stramonium TaxID=4076 RepID=A0ABS8VJ91_DATST|nr:hypothetical protein [Datura stramonium]
MSPNRTCNSSSWTREEDKAFETALALYSGDSDLLLKIAAEVPQKSLSEVIQHYNDLVEDINDIESGKVPLPQYEKMQSCTSRRSRLSRAEVERRKGTAWTTEEHRLFLQGLAKHGRGDWRSISRNFVLSRTPTQVASHAQKFFGRLNDDNKGKRRRSIHDITSVAAADIVEPSQGQKSDSSKGPCGGQSQCPITDYVTEAFDTGMPSLPGPVTNCTTDAIEGSAANPEKFPLGAAVGSELNSSLPDADEFLLCVEDLITVPAEGTSGAWPGVDTRTSASLSLQPSVDGGAGMYTHPVTVPAEGTSGVWHGVNTGTSPSLNLQPSVAGGPGMYTHPVAVPVEGTSGVRCGVNTRKSPSLSLQQPSVAGGTGMYTHPVTIPAEGSSGAWSGIDMRSSPSLSLQPSVAGGTGMYTHPVTVPAEGTSGAWRGVSTWTSPSLSLQPSVAGATGLYTRPANNVVYELDELMTKQLVGVTQVGPTFNTATFPLSIADHIGVHGCTASSSGAKHGFESTVVAPEGVLPVDSMQLPSIPGTSGGGTYPSLNPSSKDDNIFDLEDLFPDDIIGFGK